MTRTEVITLLSNLHKAGLANEPKDNKGLVESWSACFADDDPRIIYKACYIYIKIRHNRFFPSSGDIEALKLRATWLVEMDEEEAERKKIEEKKVYIETKEEKCPMQANCVLYHDLCNGPERNVCPYEGL